MNKEQKEQKDKKEHLKVELGHVRRGTGTRMKRYRIFKTVLLHIYLGRHGLTVASYITTGSVVYVFPIIQSVIIRCINIKNIYEPLVDSWLPKFTGEHSYAARSHLEKTLYLVCIHYVPRVHTYTRNWISSKNRTRS